MTIHDLDSPALLVDLDRLEANVTRMAALARTGQQALRPHIKTHKSPNIARKQLELGAVGITVAKLGEVDVFADHGFDDFFVAHLVVGQRKIEHLLALLRRVRLVVGVDSIVAAEALAAAGRQNDLTIPVRIKVDTGHHRSGVRTAIEAIDLAKWIDNTQGIELRGLYTHEGHIYKITPADRLSVCQQVVGDLLGIQSDLSRLGISCADISVGATPSAEIMCCLSGVTEIRPGVYALLDRMQSDLLPAPLSDCALTVLTTVIGRPDPSTAILDGGTKTFSGDKAPDHRGHGTILGYEDVSFDWASEEHGHLDMSQSSSVLSIGDRVRVVPWHACACVNMHDRFWIVRDETILDSWPVAARGRVQ